MVSKNPEEGLVPQFPALAKCILVDARHGSRSELVKEINASGLFLAIVEAKSVQNGLGMLENLHTDALILGPTVSVATMVDFLAEAKKCALSDDCAYLAVLDAEASDEQVQKLLQEGAHNVIRRPFNRLRFFEAVVQAIVKANANSPWTSLYKQGVEQGIFGAIQVVDAKPEVDIGAVTQVVEPEKQAASVTTVTMNSSTERLREIIMGLERGLYALDPTGAPTRRTVDALNEVAKEMLGSSTLGDPEVDVFHSFIIGALREWFVDLVQEDKMVATEKLRKTLLAYVPKN